MLLQIPSLLDPVEVQAVRAIVEHAEWSDGRITAGTQSAAVKNNLQLRDSSDAAKEAGSIVAAGLNRSALFLSATLPRRLVPPLFNRYEGNANAFGNHVDNAVRTLGTGLHVRTDISATLFLSDPESYDGGELMIEDSPTIVGALSSSSTPTREAARSIKLRAGDLVIYPGSSVHRVEPVTRGTRLASFFWIESMVRETERRRLLFDMDMALFALRQQQQPRQQQELRQQQEPRRLQGDEQAVVQLTACYHNLLRMWTDV